jgi:hypothetical protein
MSRNEGQKSSLRSGMVATGICPKRDGGLRGYDHDMYDY